MKRWTGWLLTLAPMAIATTIIAVTLTLSPAGGGGLALQVATVAKLDQHVAIAVASSIPLTRPHALTALLIAVRHPFAVQSMANKLATPALSGGRSAVLGSTRCIARPTEMKNATPLLGIFPARGILVWGENHAMARDNKANGLDVPDNNLCRFLSPTQANHFRILNVP
jgi:hypothetical protein